MASGYHTTGSQASSDGTTSNARVYYYVIDQVRNKNWKSFARTELGLSEASIDDIEYDHSSNIMEQKYQMILLWTKQYGGNVNTAEKLLQLLHEFKLSYVTSERLESLKEIISDDNTTSTQASSGSSGEPSNVYNFYGSTEVAIDSNVTFSSADNSSESQDVSC